MAKEKAREITESEKKEIALKDTQKKEEVTETIKEIETEQKNRKKKKTPILLRIASVVFFPITLSILLFRYLQLKIKIPLTVKMTIIFSILFIFIMTFFLVLVTVNVDSQLPNTPEADKYLFNFKIMLIVAFFVCLILFVALGVVISQFMLSPIRKITTEIDNISADNLDARIQPVDSQDEIKELIAQINGMLDNIQESFTRQQNFVADASHELKTPIAVIQGYADMLDRWGKKDTAILDEGIESIRNEATNMKKIVEQLLLLARLGKMTMNPVEFDLSELVCSVVEGYRLVVKNHIINYEGKEMITVNADKNLLTESIRTLVDNAVKYTNSGGVIDVRVYMENDAANISVKDNGKGISEKDLPHVFDRFYRCDKARGRESGSSGLGLTIAKSIVENMGGTISVKSVQDKGSEFIIKLI